MKRCGLRPQSLSTAPFDRAQWRTTTCQPATASFEESRVAELDRKRAARKQQVINTTGTVWPCDRCSRTCSSRIGLVAHRRPHPSVTQSAVFDDALHVCVCDPDPSAFAAGQLYRVRFKLCCLVHAIHYGRSPAYLTETVQSVGASRSRCGLRSSSTSSMDYSLPRLRTSFGERAFSHAGPATWNALPDHIRTVADPVKFRKLLKSLYFSQAFNI